ncbi:hypothetical protein [Pontibacterium sp.]|uniref:hypothetical protein n=1 Tax=Pontibacterium sp. TaxID=2036026 RepID=UPI003565A712
MSSLTPQMHKHGRADYQYPGVFLGTGNRCGHNPAEPQFDRYSPKLKTGKKYPLQQQKLIDAVDQYYWEPARIPTLAYLSGSLNADGSPRQNRSEAREAQTLLIKAILSMTEFATLLVGTPLDNGKFLHRSCEEIARAAGLLRKDQALSDDPASDCVVSARAWRHIKNLQRAGFVELHQQYEIIPGEYERAADGSRKLKYRARPAIKSVSRDFLLSLGAISEKSLEKFRKDRSSAKTAREAIYNAKYNPTIEDEAQAARERLRLKQALTGAYPKPGATPAPKPVKTTERTGLEVKYNRARLEALVQLKAAHPKKAASEITAQLREEFPSLDDWIRLQRQRT